MAGHYTKLCAERNEIPIQYNVWETLDRKTAVDRNTTSDINTSMTPADTSMTPADTCMTPADSTTASDDVIFSFEDPSAIINNVMKWLRGRTQQIYL